ncbi:hypothetical protein [Deinococcus hopiensis]|uniref:hypothetical protein n=1 Tax=Deinococcus hopiensis TaxID=309885 RepID=UPI000A01F28D|nr:hypothetical protein [Deinococcus hopiensis]
MLERVPHLRLEARVRDVLQAVLGNARRIPLYHTDKADFGDLDVLVLSPRLTAEAVEAGEYRRQGMGHTFLAPVSGEERAFQVELFPASPAQLQARFAFMPRGDGGNILGRMVKPLGLTGRPALRPPCAQQLAP